MRDEIFVIWNPCAGSVEENAALRAELEQYRHVDLHQTESAEHARQLAQEAVRRNVGLVVAAGGDGTVNAVVNGLAANPANARLAVLPLGTGNDLCRTLAIPPDPVDAAELLIPKELTGGTLRQMNFRRVDLVEVETAGHRSWCINMAAGGNSGHLMETLSAETKERWGPLCYFRGAVDVITELIVYDTTIRFDDDPPQRYSALNIVVGNGRYSAGGLRVAPRANPEDGLLDVIVIEDGSPIDLMNIAAHYILDDYLESDHVVLRRARRVSIEATPPIPFSADGDLLGHEPVTLTVQPAALQIVVGPEYTPQSLD